MSAGSSPDRAIGGSPRPLQPRRLPLVTDATPTVPAAALRAAERALDERNQQMDLIEELAGLGSWEVDAVTGTLRWSREQQRIHGVDDATTPRTHAEFVASILHPDDRAVVAAAMEAVADHGPLTVEYRIMRPDGTVRLLQARGRLVHDDAGRPARVIGTSLDITDRRAAEEALRASEASYRTIFAHASDAMWVHDLQTGDFLEVNQAAVDMYGWTAAEQKARGFAGLSTGEAPYRTEDALAHAARAAAGEPQRFVWLGRHRDGRPVWGEVRLRRVTLDGVDRLLATARDIGDRVAAEAALRQANERLERRVAERTAELEATLETLAEREERYRTLIESAGDLAVLIDPTGTLTYVSPASARVIGWTPEELVGQSAEVLLHPDDRERGLGELAQVMQRPGEPLTSTVVLLHKDGGRRTVESVARTVSATSPAAGVIAVARDVTARLAAEQALRERDQHFRRLIEDSSDFLMTCDATGAITYIGSSVERMLGFTAAQMIGDRPDARVHPDDVPVVMAAIASLAASPGSTTTVRYRHRHRDGRWRWIESVGRTVSPDSVADGLVGNCRDVTERVEAEEALARAKEEAERANRAKSEFLSRMSHELRTPMNSILGFAQLLARTELAPPHAKGVQHILKAGRHLLRLINEVLEIARIEAGREQFTLEPVALARVIPEALGLVRPLAEQHGVTLDEPELPEDAVVVADRQRLVQVLLNLLSNAIKYNRAGGHVAVRVASADAPDGSWLVRVVDSGRGIAPERVDELFTPFARLGAEQSEVEGTGLGLALSQRLCEAMGGALALERTGPAGSTFRLELAAAEQSLRALEETGTHAVPDAAHRPATLLYVEDNLANLSLVETILLVRPRWRTMSALRGQLGVELAREHQPDLMLLDLHLPDMSGLEVLRRLREDPRTAGIPVVVVSADATTASVEELRTAGADAYLTKPLDVDEFLGVVGRFLPEGEGGEDG